MELRVYPDPILSKKCEEVENGDESAVEFLDKMIACMDKYSAGGFAAPQFGVLKRMIVTIASRDEPDDIYKMINPKIVWKSESLIEACEGCISVGVHVNVVRHELISVEYLNEKFEKCTIEKTTNPYLQHEIDHLDGILNIDRLSRLKRASALRKLKKIREEGADVEE